MKNTKSRENTRNFESITKIKEFNSTSATFELKGDYHEDIIVVVGYEKSTEETIPIELERVATGFNFGLVHSFVPKINSEGILNSKCRKKLALTFSKRWNKKFKWRSNFVSPLEILGKQAVDLVKLIEHKGDYRPFKMKW